MSGQEHGRFDLNKIIKELLKFCQLVPYYMSLRPRPRPRPSREFTSTHIFRYNHNVCYHNENDIPEEINVTQGSEPEHMYNTALNKAKSLIFFNFRGRGYQPQTYVTEVKHRQFDQNGRINSTRARVDHVASDH